MIPITRILDCGDNMDDVLLTERIDNNLASRKVSRIEAAQIVYAAAVQGDIIYTEQVESYVSSISIFDRVEYEAMQKLATISVQLSKHPEGVVL